MFSHRLQLQQSLHLYTGRNRPPEFVVQCKLFLFFGWKSVIISTKKSIIHSSSAIFFTAEILTRSPVVQISADLHLDDQCAFSFLLFFFFFFSYCLCTQNISAAIFLFLLFPICTLSMF